jgi:putative DNA primase/helicase
MSADTIDFAERIEQIAKKKRLEAGPILDPADPIASARQLMAACFVDVHGHRTLHRHRGAFYRYTGTHYRLAEDEEIRGTAWEFMECARRCGNDGSPVPFKPLSSKVSNLADALTAVAFLDPDLAPPAWLSDGKLPAHEFMPMANGLLHLPSGVSCALTAEFFALGASEVMFDPEAPEPAQWLRFLQEALEGDTEAMICLQDWFGYFLTTDTRQQKILLLKGPKRSGKGTIARVLGRLLGSSNVAGPTLASLSSNFGLEPLIGKSLAIISDARLGKQSDTAAISERLLSISGEDALTIDRKFRQAWTGKLPLRFMVLTNKLPHLTDSSGALASRFIVLDLRRSFYGREDKTLSDRLYAELPGILNWSLDGYRRLQERGHFIQPASALETIDTFEALTQPIGAFIDEKCRVGPGLSAPVDALYNAWRDWCSANGKKEPGTKQTFGAEFHDAFPGIRMSRPRDEDGSRFRAYEGVAIR